MERNEFLKRVIANCGDEEAVAYAKERLEKSEEYAKRKRRQVSARYDGGAPPELLRSLRYEPPEFIMLRKR